MDKWQCGQCHENEIESVMLQKEQDNDNEARLEASEKCCQCSVVPSMHTGSREVSVGTVCSKKTMDDNLLLNDQCRFIMFLQVYFLFFLSRACALEEFTCYHLLP
jgi:hypothetical protein